MSQTRKGDHVFNIFHEILEIFWINFVLTIPSRWLKVGVTANPEKKTLKMDFYYNLKNSKLCRLVVLTML